jgi:hypothetical protein
MEKRINKKCELFVQEFKSDIKKYMDSRNLSKDSQYSDFLQYLYDYPSIKLSKEYFQKRKRIKNIVPQFDRCTAKRANGEQCTRRKKDSSEYCGTHVKGTPHGEIVIDASIDSSISNKVEIQLQEIQGIHYYIDKNYNVYKMEDIINNSKSPSVISKYKIMPNGEYKLIENEQTNYLQSAIC